MKFMFFDMPYYLASLKWLSAARWAQNATTVAGLANGTGGSFLGQLQRNYGVYYADDDILYIADTQNNRVVLIASNSTTAIRVIGQGPSANMSTFNGPNDVFVTQNAIYVMDNGNYRVQKWSRNFSNPVTVAGLSGVKGTSTNMTTLGFSYNLFVDNYGNLLVSNYGYNRVTMFPWNSTSGTTGMIVAGTGVQGAHAHQLDGPSGIFVADDRSLYIADTNNNRIQKWTIGGTYGLTVAGTGIAGSRLSQLNSPYTVLVDFNGYMYITDYGNHRIVRWAPDSTDGECIAACLGGSGISPNRLYGPSSITFDSRGSLYVNDYRNNRVQKFAIVNDTSIISVE